MNLFWRFLCIFLTSRFSSAVNLFDSCTIQFRVLPTDIDPLGHLNNGRYFSLQDLARINFMIRNKTYSILQKNKIYGVVASEMIRFKKSIGFFKRFQITTQLLGWDNNFFYIVHRFKMKNQLCALSAVKICFLKYKKERLPTEEILKLVSITQQSKEIPNWLKKWQNADQEFYAASRS